MSGALATAGILAGVGAAGSIGGALIGSSASNNAANTQANAANNAAALQYQASQNALDFQKQQWAQQQQNLSPWLQTGAGALSNLAYLLGVNPDTSVGQTTNYQTGTGVSGTRLIGQTGAQSPTVANGGIRPQAGVSQAIGAGADSPAALAANSGLLANNGVHSVTGLSLSPTSASGSQPNTSLGSFGSLSQPYGQTFSAPTGLTEQNDPGYQARLKMGTDALERSAAARGGVLTGGTAQAENQYAQDYASNEYNNVYNRALQNFNTNYNVWSNDQSNQFNRLAALAGVGQTAANTLGSEGNAAANNVSSNLLNTASQMGQQYNNAAAATASGYVGGANAWNSALSGLGGNLSNLYMLYNSGLLGGGGGNYVGGGSSWNELG